MSNSIMEFEREARRSGYHRIAGVDEVGRGPLAGPVVSAAVILPVDFCVEGIADSKRLSSRVRQRLYKEIYSTALTVGIGIVDPVEIDRINIFQASLAAMAMAVNNLGPGPDCILVDGCHPIGLDMPEKAVVQGDSKSVSIASASIVAKVSRDNIMERYCTEYPEYGFARHKGYPTKAHVSAIRDYGWCPIHRRSFKGVRGQRRSHYTMSGLSA